MLWHGVDPAVVCGGFPCQDISVAGRGVGLSGSRSVLWFEMLRVIDETNPKYAVIENVSALRSRGLDAVLGGLTSIGYDAEWHCVPAAAVGAPHRRDRIWILAYPQPGRRGGRGSDGQRPNPALPCGSGRGSAVAYPDPGGRRIEGHEFGAIGGKRSGQPGVRSQTVADAGGAGLSGTEQSGWPVPFITPAVLWGTATQCRWRRLEPGMGGTDDGLPARVHRYPVAVEPWEGDTPRTVGRGYPDRRQRLMSLGNSLVPTIAEMIGRAIILREESL